MLVTWSRARSRARERDRERGVGAESPSSSDGSGGRSSRCRLPGRSAGLCGDEGSEGDDRDDVSVGGGAIRGEGWVRREKAGAKCAMLRGRRVRTGGGGGGGAGFVAGDAGRI